ncbi:VOC family protein [Streptomyces sp. ADMS]
MTLGATVSARHDGHVVLLNPEGNEFCVAEGA